VTCLRNPEADAMSFALDAADWVLLLQFDSRGTGRMLGDRRSDADSVSRSISDQQQ